MEEREGRRVEGGKKWKGGKEQLALLKPELV